MQDGDVGDPFRPLYLGLQEPGTQIIPGPCANGQVIANIDWTLTATYADCSRTQGPYMGTTKLGSFTGVNIKIESLGTIVVTATIS